MVLFSDSSIYEKQINTNKMIYTCRSERFSTNFNSAYFARITTNSYEEFAFYLHVISKLDNLKICFLISSATSFINQNAFSLLFQRNCFVFFIRISFPRNTKFKKIERDFAIIIAVLFVLAPREEKQYWNFSSQSKKENFSKY